MGKKIKFNVCGLSASYFIPFFIIVMVTVYCGFMPVAGGVASAIEKCVNEYYPGVEVKIEHAEGLADCKKILSMAKIGRMNGCLIEGMGCPGGCVAGAGTNIPVPKAQKKVQEFVKASSKQLPPKELGEIELK